MKKKLVCGVGLNDATYIVCPRIQVDGKWIHNKTASCPYYAIWAAMLKRCYSARVRRLRPTYEKVTVCQDWLTFSKFKKWVETQNWQGKALDKDLLIENNTIYSPETCVFIDNKLNAFLTLRQNRRGTCLLGVSLTQNGKFKSEGYDIHGNRLYFGVFNNDLDAHIRYLENKLAHVLHFIEKEVDIRVLNGLIRVRDKLESAIYLRNPINKL